ncbi:hypothetical protein G7Y89_g2522 [Cudoniella acicularis]|uniref:AA9 family lytic polysaccharide monooxygenase n=1 Tax=Cudoniella acicularis TaxID=354080 RepID=A0A8H4RUX6_9HELO|nr:hypothetical protein G7Y89_g2522 [Cudoniella acicularis]
MASRIFKRIREGVPPPHLKAEGTENAHGEDVWLDNDDVRPLKLTDRTWNLWAYLTFWFSATATVSNWYAASSAQALKLRMWESLGCSVGGQALIAIVIVSNGRAGAKYRIGYLILNRAAFGIFGAWWPTFNRAVMAIVWNGVDAVQGGQCVYVMLHALTPKIANIKNIMGDGSAFDSGGMIGFGVFWVCTCFFLVIPIPKMRGLVYAKLIVFIISAAAMCAWTLTKASGIGEVARQPGTATGSERTWLLIRFFLPGAANCATFASNAADFQRYATKPNDVIVGNILGFPLTNGFFICAVISFAINPWYLLGSASIFISFLASYQIFLSAITGVLLCHYYIVSRGYLEIGDLYTSRKDGVYHYFYGWNWRAYLTYIIGIAPNFYGFLNNMGWIKSIINFAFAYHSRERLVVGLQPPHASAPKDSDFIQNVNFDPATNQNSYWFNYLWEISRTTLGERSYSSYFPYGPPGWPVTIPKNLKAGKYLIRHEVIAIRAGTDSSYDFSKKGFVDFYPSCAQIEVTGAGKAVLAKKDLVSFPGAHKWEGKSKYL